MASPANEALVREFIAAWARLDADELVAFFTSDGTYHNMMAKPVSGHDDLRRFIGRWSAASWAVVNLVGRGDVVIAERVDRIRLGDKLVELPCCGVFEISGGKIKVWRDYFDLATYTSAAS